MAYTHAHIYMYIYNGKTTTSNVQFYMLTVLYVTMNIIKMYKILFNIVPKPFKPLAPATRIEYPKNKNKNMLIFKITIYNIRFTILSVLWTHSSKYNTPEDFLMHFSTTERICQIASTLINL